MEPAAAGRSRVLPLWMAAADPRSPSLLEVGREITLVKVISKYFLTLILYLEESEASSSGSVALITYTTHLHICV